MGARRKRQRPNMPRSFGYRSVKPAAICLGLDCVLLHDRILQPHPKGVRGLCLKPTRQPRELAWQHPRDRRTPQSRPLTLSLFTVPLIHNHPPCAASYLVNNRIKACHTSIEAIHGIGGGVVLMSEGFILQQKAWGKGKDGWAETQHQLSEYTQSASSCAI